MSSSRFPMRKEEGEEAGEEEDAQEEEEDEHTLVAEVRETAVAGMVMEAWSCS